MDAWEHYCDPGKMHIFVSLGEILEQSHKYNQIVFIDSSLFLIG